MERKMKLTGLMMSVLLCLFTSCGGDEEGDGGGSTGVATVQVDMFVASETLSFAEGSFVITFSPSGKREEIKVNDLIFAFDANPVTDAGYLEKFKSAHVKKGTITMMCNRSDTKISIRPNLRVKAGVATTDDKNYDYEVAGVIKYQNRDGSIQKNSQYSGQRGLQGSVIESYLDKMNNLDLVYLNVR